MADHFPDATKKVDYISRETAISEIMSEPTDAHYPSWYAEKLKQIPAADVRPVVSGEWWPAKDGYYGHVMCSVCHTIESHETGFCPNCGADMQEPNLDTTKGGNHD